MAQELKTALIDDVKSENDASISIEKSSETWLNWIMLALTLVGIGISSYLTWTHYTDTPIICTTDHSCDTVNRSAYAYFPPNKGLPVAVLGLVGYVGILGLVIGYLTRKQMRGNLTWLLFMVTLGGVVFSGYLTAMELWVINAICWWCVGSAVTMSLLFAISAKKVWSSI